MKALCYQRQSGEDGSKVIAVAGSTITVDQVVEIVKKEFPELGEEPNIKRIGVMYHNGFFGIRVIEESE